MSVENEAVDLEALQEMREELLDPGGWSEVLGKYARTVGLAVAMTDSEGRQLGPCHNPQAAWLMAHTENAENDGGTACSFCLDSSPPCKAVKTALSTGNIELVSDRAGLVHLAIPLSLGPHQLGAIIAGQVFDRYPEPLRLERVARNVGIPPQRFWQQARLQAPVRNATLLVYGELLLTLGRAFLRQRYAAILDRKLARANLRLRLLLEGVKGQALFIVDGTGTVTTWNRGAERVFGYSADEVLGQDFSRFFAPEDIQNGAPFELLQRADRDGWVHDQGWQVRKDGTRFFSEGSLAVLGGGDSREFGRLTLDVTDRRNAEEALRNAQKLESIGVLASGIAHDFNNLLSGILGGVTFARANLPPDHSANPSLEIAEEACERAADLAQQLLAYAGQGKFVVTRFDLSSMVRDMLNLLQTSIPKSVDLQMELEPDLPWIEGDASQIRQIVMNLAINGAESIGLEGGSLRVSTGMASPEEQSEGKDGMDVYMEVRDTGSGMSEATQARIFDPFFTTKFTGRGLGLAAVAGIVRGHGGRMKVQSALGKGSSFRICFPGVERRLPPKPAPAVVSSSDGAGAVLVVDDELALRTNAQRILKHYGYNVLLAENGREGIETFRQNADIITAILLDMTMPVMGGEEAFRLIRTISATVPIIVSTGYSEVPTLQLFSPGALIAFLQKPYTAARLRDAIQNAVAAAKAVKDATPAARE